MQNTPSCQTWVTPSHSLQPLLAVHFCRVQCYAVLCCAVLCCAVLCCAVLCCADPGPACVCRNSSCQSWVTPSHPPLPRLLCPSVLCNAVLCSPRGRLEMQNFIMPVVGHTISLTRLVTDPTSRDNPDRQQGVLGDNLREVSTQSKYHNCCSTVQYSTVRQRYCLALHPPLGDNLREVRTLSS
jgi:hypothetical protein